MNQLNVDRVADALTISGLEVIDILDAWWQNDDRAEYAAFFVYDERKQRLAREDQPGPGPDEHPVGGLRGRAEG